MKKNQGAKALLDIFDPSPIKADLPFCEHATVISPLPDLKIKLRDITYKKENIFLDEYWISGHEREIEIPMAQLQGTDSRGDGHIQGAFPKAKIIFKDELKAGDQVAVLQSKDKQGLYVLFKIGRF